ncbi:MAG TPA: hypothetical protein EYQ12_08035, partial [Oceanospirillaceae bacterium]|nr:hypothetical protein [Oceanospirillaceae bacterium]
MSQRLKSSLAVGVLTLLGKLPLRWLHRISNALIFLLLIFPNQSHRQTKINIERCFPELNPTHKANLVRQSLRHTLYAAL